MILTGLVEESLGNFGVLPNEGPIVRYSRVRKYRIGDVGVIEFYEKNT